MTLTRLSQNLYVYHGAVNVGIVRAGTRALLIDYGDGSVWDALRQLGIQRVERVLVTHHHRDQVSGLLDGAGMEAEIGVPSSEEQAFSNVDAYWTDPGSRWHLYDFHPHHLMLPRSICVQAAVEPGDTIQWRGIEIAALSTPGHTEGSLSYRVEVDGQRTLFCGDLMCGDGQIWELYSLQKGEVTRDYHGFLGARKRLQESLACARAVDALRIVPAHGELVVSPAAAIDKLCARLDACYERYVGISALRHYFPELFTDYQVPAASRDGAPAWMDGMMPVRGGWPVPDFMTHIGTTWLVRSANGNAFALDCGSAEVVRRVQALQAGGEIGVVEWLWITHYHDDHVDAIPQFQAAMGCAIVADEHVARVVQDPLAWRLPCISPVQVNVDRCTGHGESWAWHEFTITAFHLPGQTLYHGGLLVEGRGHRVLFAGDSFTPSGIDDYCAGNRNWLGRGVGFDACLQLVEQVQPEIILNCHVDVAFSFTADECRQMRANLAEREGLYGELLAWEHPNYGMDESWVRCYPYEQRVCAGQEVRLRVVFTNHSVAAREAAARLILPAEWGIPAPSGRVTIEPGREGQIAYSVVLPTDLPPRRWVVPVDVTYGDRRLGQVQEAIMESRVTV